LFGYSTDSESAVGSRQFKDFLLQTADCLILLLLHDELIAESDRKKSVSKEASRGRHLTLK
jgi:hypothetical protein